MPDHIIKGALGLKGDPRCFSELLRSFASCFTNHFRRNIYGANEGKQKKLNGETAFLYPASFQFRTGLSSQTHHFTFHCKQLCAMEVCTVRCCLNVACTDNEISKMLALFALFRIVR